MCIALSAMLCLSVGVGCGGGSQELDTSEKNLIISCYEGGYGSEAMKQIVNKFEEHYKSEGYTVTFTSDHALISTTAVSKLQAGPSVTPIDMFMPGDVNFRYIVAQGANFIKGYDCGLEDLTDVFNQKVYGEDVLFKDKINAQLADNCATVINGETRYYALPFCGGTTGFAYNNELFEQNGWTLPKTTDELIALVAEIRADGATPFVWSQGTSYWDYALMPWWRQLITDEEEEKFWSCIDANGEVSAEVFRSQALLTATTVLEKLIYDTENSHPKSMTFSHIEAQMAMYDKKNKCAMMITGDWLENEMSESGYQPGQVDIGLMKVPVCSDVIYTYDSIGNRNFKYRTIQSDAKLSEVIAAVDANKTSVEGVSAEDFAAIQKIRSYTYGSGFLFNALIPSYANAKEVAKKFLLYLASDEAQQIYFDETGALLPFTSNNLVRPTNPTRLQTAVLDSLGKTTYISNATPKTSIFYNTDLRIWRGDIAECMGTHSTADKMTAAQIWQRWYDDINSNFDYYLSQS